MANYLVGEIVLWPASFTPEGFLPCDGRLVNRNDYNALYAHIGYDFGGSGDQFAVPLISGPVPENSEEPITYLIATNGLSGPEANLPTQKPPSARSDFSPEPLEASPKSEPYKQTGAFTKLRVTSACSVL